MRTWKIILAGTMFSAALILTIAGHGSDAFGPGERSVATRGVDLSPPNTDVPDPTPPTTGIV